ncbi:MAG: phage tail tube protein [Caldilineaceae bacterium]
MPVISADTLQLSHAVETSPGILPASPVFHTWRTTGESLVFAPQTSDSAELGGPGRFQKPATVTGTTISGSINFELAKFPALEEAMAGVFAANWGECPLTGAVGGGIDSVNDITVGKTLKTFTIEKRFPNPAFVAGTLPTASAGSTGTQTSDVTIGAATATGTGTVKVTVKTSTGAEATVLAPINVGDDEAAVASTVAAALTADGITATASTNTVTIDAGAGNTIVTLTAVAGSDEFFYQRFSGVTYSALSLSVAPNQTITGSVDIIGGVPSLDTLPLSGATYQSAGSNPIFTSPEVMELSVGQALGVGTHCWTSLNININSQNRGIPCIGSKGDREVVLGTLTAEVSGDVYFSDQDILDALLNNKTIGDSVITLSDTDGNLYRWDFFDMKPTAGQVAAGGAGQDLTIPLTLQPTPVSVCEDGSGNVWESGFILSTENTAPTLP